MSIVPAAALVMLATLALACSGGDGDDDDAATTNPTTSPTVGDDDDGSTTAEDTGASTTAASSTTDVQPESSSSSSPESSGSAEAESTGPINMCDPVVPGEWNACQDENGQVDNTLCNWTGQGGATGFIGCLQSSEMKGANVCFISGCRDTCDCFAPPVTGTAEVVCGPILEGGDNGCGLDCGNGRTCPDGMECLGSLCFWPPA